MTGRRPHPVRPGMFLETVSKVMLCHIFYVEWLSLKQCSLRFPWNEKLLVQSKFSVSIENPNCYNLITFSYAHFLIYNLIIT